MSEKEPSMSLVTALKRRSQVAGDPAPNCKKTEESKQTPSVFLEGQIADSWVSYFGGILGFVPNLAKRIYLPNF